MAKSTLPNLFYLNALFDLELGGYPIESIRAGAIEMGPLFCFCGNKNDRVLLDVNVPGDYGKYLDSLSIPYAPPFGNCDNPVDFAGVAWGWNRGSAGRLGTLGVNCRHPDLDCVGKINNRKFCADFNRSTGTGVPGTRFCTTADEVEKAVHDLNDKLPLVAKPAFGGSGMGFVSIHTLNDGEAKTENLLAHGGCTIEPWCNRIQDISSSCMIDEKGNISALRHYRCFTNGRGMFNGVTFGGNDAIVEKYRASLETAARRACASLSNAGYSGPVSFDSFVYRDNASGEEKLAPVIEINGRYFMSAIAYALFEKTGKDRVCLFRFVGKKKCALPDSYDILKKQLGELGYDPEKRRGIMVLSPLRVMHEKEWVQPVRSAFFIVGRNRGEVEGMDELFRPVFT